MPITLDDLRRHAVARTFFTPTTLARAIRKLGFVQADPIRAPARAQDLTLRHRVLDYRAGDLERRYARLGIEEDFFVNYGFLPRAHHALMHPRTPRTVWPAARWAQAEAVLAFVRARGEAHPREVDAEFAHGKASNGFGGMSNASTQLLDAMHHRGLLRVARRDAGTRIYAARDAAGSVAGTAAAGADALPAAIEAGALSTGAQAGRFAVADAAGSLSAADAAGAFSAVDAAGALPASIEAGGRSAGAAAGALLAGAVADAVDAAGAAQRLDALIDLAVQKYAPVTGTCLAHLVSRLRHGAPQWPALRGAALVRARGRLAHARIDGAEWYWPANENPAAARWRPAEGVRLLTPFDPLVWDRRRFEHFWGWAYRFEAYTPASKRKLGYYALPLLWGEQVIGWGNVAVAGTALTASFGYTSGRAPRGGGFRAGLDDELGRMRCFLGLG